MKSRTYLCGPMTGLPEYNYPAFMAVATALRQAGHQVVNPAEDGLPVLAPWGEHLRLAICKLLTCQQVATLPGCEHSKGAQLELHIARQLGMPVVAAAEMLSTDQFAQISPL